MFLLILNLFMPYSTLAEQATVEGTVSSEETPPEDRENALDGTTGSGSDSPAVEEGNKEDEQERETLDDGEEQTEQQEITESEKIKDTDIDETGQEMEDPERSSDTGESQPSIESDEEPMEDDSPDSEAEEGINRMSMMRMSAAIWNETAISKLGHLKNSSTVIYTDLNNLTDNFVSGASLQDSVYYIKRQAESNGQVYYLLSEQPSSTNGLIGWVKAGDVSVHDHKGVDSRSKKFHIKGSGKAYSKAWGGNKDLVYDLSAYAGAEFTVNKTETVGRNYWYRGTLDGRSVFIHSSYLTPPSESTSRLGHLKTENAVIFKDLLNGFGGTAAGSQHTGKVYYIKQQADFENQLYYLLSSNPSSETGVVGWVKAGDVNTHEHKGVDSRSKKVYVKGSGKAYSKAWGGNEDEVYDLSSYAGMEFAVNKTETVGKNYWYRGTLNGRTVFIHSAYLETRAESNTSKLGHLKNQNVLIYENILDPSRSKAAGRQNADKVFFIKQQAQFDNQLYYLISNEASSAKGVVGWVKAGDLSTHDHSGVDTRSKTFYINGNGDAFSKAWGGTGDKVYSLSSYKGQVFKVHKTERVGNNTWYRGDLDGKRVFIHSAFLGNKTETATSKLGHLKNSNVLIYQNVGDKSTASAAGNGNMNNVFYIKKQAVAGGQTYYLISNQASSSSGVVGWVRAGDLNTHDHTGVDTKRKVFYINGSGNAFSRAWGGSRNMVYDLASYSGREFIVNKTEKVGNNTWYRGVLAGKTVWIHQSFLNQQNIFYSKFNITLNDALNIQMKQLQQTDKYRNDKAYIHKNNVAITRTGAIIGNGVRLRSAPNFNNNIRHTVNNGTRVNIVEEVTGEMYQGSNKWYKITYSGETLYVHNSLASRNALVASTTTRTDVRASASNSGHIFGTLAAGTSVNIIKEGSTWHEISYTTWRNPTRSDVQQYLDPNNNDIFQHLVLSESAGVSAASLNNVLKGKGILAGKGQSFINGAKQHRVNEVYLISHALLETGNGNSALATGIEVGLNSSGKPVLVTASNRNSLKSIKKVYNMFGIGAVDGDAHRAGAVRAYEEKWFTPEAAITGGAKFIGARYIHNSYNQDTLYKMRWNPANPGYPQYATDIAWATKQVTNIKNMYAMLDNPVLRFNIIQYK